MRENFEVIPSDILDNVGVLRTLKESFEKQKAIYRPNPEDFADKIPQGIIEDDLERVEKKKETFVEESEIHTREKIVADIFEGIVVDQFSGNWFGGRAEGHFTSEPDDLLRGVDVVAEIKSEEEHGESEYLGFALDVTFSQNQDIVQKKLEGIWYYDVEKHSLGEVRYFESEDYKGSLDLPRVVVSANRDTVRDLTRMYHRKDRAGLEEHPFQYSLLSQIKIQLESYYQHAQATAPGSRYTEIITQSLAAFYEIYNVKEEEIAAHIDSVVNDPQFKFVQQFCENKLVDLTK